MFHEEDYYLDNQGKKTQSIWKAFTSTLFYKGVYANIPPYCNYDHILNGYANEVISSVRHSPLATHIFNSGVKVFKDTRISCV